MRVVILGLSITSSWGNGHATNYRALARALADRGDELLFLERDMPWYATHRDLPAPPWGETVLYNSPAELEAHRAAMAAADLVIVGSFVPDGVEVADWALRHAGGAVAFYDIDTPVTLDKLARGDHAYLHPRTIPRFDVYLSFTAGPALARLSERYGARRPEAFFCFVDPDAYRPVPGLKRRWELTYLGTYSAGRQPGLDELLVKPAISDPELRAVVAGPMYPPELDWPVNVKRIEHVPPGEHPGFYGAGAWTLNITRPEMRALGHSPSVRLFEAAACGVPIISDTWPGIEAVLEPGREIVLAERRGDVLAALARPDEDRRAIGAAARERVLAEHTAARRVDRLHDLVRAAA